MTDHSLTPPHLVSVVIGFDRPLEQPRQNECEELEEDESNGHPSHDVEVVGHLMGYGICVGYVWSMCPSNQVKWDRE